jgi:mono/diheme cytochrome c family protein
MDKEKAARLLLLEATTAVATATLMSVIVLLGWTMWLQLQTPTDVPAVEPEVPKPAAQSQKPNPAQLGKQLFRNQCATCHNRNMKDAITGPALGGVEGRWMAYPKADLYHFIRNAQKMIRKKHPRAVQLWREYQPYQMNDFSDLTDEEIAAILAYIKMTDNAMLVY